MDVTFLVMKVFVDGTHAITCRLWGNLVVLNSDSMLKQCKDDQANQRMDDRISLTQEMWRESEGGSHEKEKPSLYCRIASTIRATENFNLGDLGEHDHATLLR